MTTDFKIIGFTDKVNECDCCGRTQLKGTYCISIDGNEYYYGSTCATKKGVNKVELKKEMSNYQSIVFFVNRFIFRTGLDINKTNEILEWALNNKGKSLNIFLNN
jgi:hypothetical protein